MWKWLDKIGEFAVTNARVVRDAWGAFAVWCIIALVTSWYVIDRVYDWRLSNAQFATSALNTRLVTVEGDLRDARLALAERNAGSAKKNETDPDAFYQLGALAARAPAGVVDRVNGAIHFQQVMGGPDFNVNADLDYRQFTLTKCTHGSYGSQSSGSFVITQTFWDVTCRISGLHP